MADTVVKFASDWQLDDQIVHSLQQNGIETFFPIQQQVIPELLKQSHCSIIKPRDICVSAPTGSGKTLSYAIPVMNTLLNENDVRLRALIMLPSRELAKQVFDVFGNLLTGTKLKVSLATGSTPFEEEQYQLCGNIGILEARKAAHPFEDVAEQYHPEVFLYDECLGCSKIDIVICTPGRLMDHMQFTKGFTLKHLRFLVLDEADRLLGNAYHGWVRELMSSAQEFSESFGSKKRKFSIERSTTYKVPLQRLLFSATLSDNPAALALLGIYNPLYIQCKSVIETTDVANISENTELLNTEVDEWKEEYELPATLTERKLVIESKDRIIALLAILIGAFNNKEWEDTKWNGVQNICSTHHGVCIIFVSSVETSHRLTLALKLANNELVDSDVSVELQNVLKNLNLPKQKTLFNGKVAEMTRLVKAEDRDQIMVDARNGKIKVIVSSDRMARGMDLPNLNLVINYDPPKFAKSYVHRAGRTARANRHGTCLTILKKGQVGEFRKLRSEIKHASSTGEFENVVRSCNFPASFQKILMPLYGKSISFLGKYVTPQQ